MFGFLATAWPRFLEVKAFLPWEVSALFVLWATGQGAYLSGAISMGDFVSAGACLWLLGCLTKRLMHARGERPPPGFSLAFFSVAIAVATLIAFGLGWNLQNPQLDYFLRLLGYQGFLLLPIFGIGSYLVPRFFPGSAEKSVTSRHRGIVVFGTAAVVLASFAVEVWASAFVGNVMRMLAVAGWAVLAVPSLVTGKAPGTRPWALRVGMALICLAFACRAIWPDQVFAFEHFLFLGGFTQVIPLVADRVATGHSVVSETVAPRSCKWRWVVWLMILTAATRATADLVPSTRVSHHIYAAVMLVIVFLIWWSDNGKRLLTFRKKSG